MKRRFAAILFILIPPQAYVISLYVLKVAIIYDIIRVLYYIATAAGKHCN